MRALIHCLIILGLGLTLSSCATTKSWFGKDKPDAAGQAGAEETSPAAIEEEDYEAALNKTVRRYIEAQNADRSDQKEHVIRKKPYYFKEYVHYPEGPDAFHCSIQEKDSRARPYIANVKIKKIRFATRLHRKREKARLDEDFIRDTGAETLSFEYRNSRWTRIGSIFVAERSEEFVDGAWAPVRVELTESIEEQEQPGWFNRTWNKISGNE